MAYAVTLWSQQNKTNDKSQEIKVLERAKRLELARINAGWRYHSYGTNKELLVPCDKDGKPTKRGQAMLNLYKNL